MSFTETTGFWRLLVICWTASSMYDAVRACLVHPTAVVVATGERVSLNCSGDTYVDSWQNGGNALNKDVVYRATTYNSDGSIKSHKFIAEGYSVDDPAENQAILHINNISLSQAGTYYCVNGKSRTASSAVVVLKPEFVVNFHNTNEESDSVICSILSSEHISYVLTIKDMLGSTVARKNGSSLCNGQTSCHLQHKINGNASVNQSYSCTVNVTTNGNIPFLKVLTASIECSTGDPGGRSDSHSIEKDGNYSWITISIACCGVLALVTGASALLYRYRKPIHKKTWSIRNRFKY